MDLIDPLFDAVIKGDDSVVNHILSLGISLTVNDEDGLTVLHWSVCFVVLSVVYMCIKHKY